MTQRVGLREDDRRDQQTYAIIYAAMEVHRILGSRFLEPVYQSALECELGTRAIPFVREVDLPVYYKGARLSPRYRTDFICFGRVLVELKAIERLTPREESQIINYLAASRLGRGMLLNFGAPSLEFKRFVGLAGDSPPSSRQSVKSVGGGS
jgi:GxxExxY protein